MTESEWLASADPKKMLDFLKDKTSERKMRLFAVACCRRIWHLMTDERVRQAVEVAERFADGLAGVDQMEKLSFAAEDASNEAYRKGDGILCNSGGAAIVSSQALGLRELHHGMPNIFEDVVEAAEDAGLTTRPTMLSEIAGLLRHLVGNPIRPITTDPSWLTSTVVLLARQMYESRDFTTMPNLADALQDAGCENADILNHCRGPGPHVRGCFVVDLLLGKE